MSPGCSSPDLHVTESISIPLGAVDLALTQLWKHQDAPKDSAKGLLTRACMSNLVIVCRGDEQARLVAGEVTEIVCRHPSRVLLLVADPAGPGVDAPIEAAVSAHCHVGPEERRVCSEMVEVRAGGEAIRKLPSAARSLLIGDLPKSLWWDESSPPTLSGSLFNELEAMCDQVIYSSHCWDNPVSGTLATADWSSHSSPTNPILMDLAWRGLTPWRRLIRQSLDPVSLPDAVYHLTDVEIEHGRRGLPQAWLLAGWLASSLQWRPTARSLVRGQEMSWKFDGPRGEVGLVARRLEDGPGPVRRVKTTWRKGGVISSLTFAISGPGHLSATAEGFDAETRFLSSPPLSRAQLVAAELPRLEPDFAFRDALYVSRRLAEHLSL